LPSIPGLWSISTRSVRLYWADGVALMRRPEHISGLARAPR
jgi:hypothetical protein